MYVNLCTDFDFVHQPGWNILEIGRSVLGIQDCLYHVTGVFRFLSEGDEGVGFFPVESNSREF